MLEMFIAVLLILGGLTLFLFRVIHKCVFRIDKKIKDDYFDQLQVYDKYIDAKSKRLADLQEEIELSYQDIHEVEASSSEIKYVTVAENTAEYVDEDFRRNYCLVHNSFRRIADESMKQMVNELVHKRVDLNVHEYRELQQIFDSKLQYEMLTLPSERQQEIMEMISRNSVGKKRILDSYSRLHHVFNFKEFMEYVAHYIYVHDSSVRVYSNSGECCIEDPPKQVTFYIDENISEGFIIQYRDKIYDYSV